MNTHKNVPNWPSSQFYIALKRYTEFLWKLFQSKVFWNEQSCKTKTFESTNSIFSHVKTNLNFSVRKLIHAKVHKYFVQTLKNVHVIIKQRTDDELKACATSFCWIWIETRLVFIFAWCFVVRFIFGWEKVS